MAAMGDGIVRLWCAVILQAVADFDDRNLSIREPAKDFIFSSSDRELGFLWLCDQLSLDGNKIRSMCMSREGRKKLLGKKVTKPVFTDQLVA